MMTKELLYSVQQGHDRSGWVSSIEPEPQHPVTGQPVWYISKSGAVWRGTFLERCYLSPEEYRISDRGSVFDGDHIFTIPMERVFTDRTDAYKQAVREATQMVEDLYAEYEEGCEELLQSMPAVTPSVDEVALRKAWREEITPC